MPETQTDPSSAPQRHISRSKRIVIPTAIVAIAALLIASYWYLYRRGYVSTNDAAIAADAVTVSSKILGRVAVLAAGEGDATAKGQVVARLDDTDLRAQEAQAGANLAYTRETVGVAKIGLARAEEDFARAKAQYDDKVITREQYDHARQALDLARAQCAVAESQVKASEAQLGVVETQLGNTQIISPITGIVARKWVTPGDIVQPSQPIFTLYDLDDVWVTANFEETKLGAIRIGQDVRISVDAYPGREFAGRVTLIGAAAASQFSLIPASNASGNFTKVTQRVPVRISVDRAGTAPGSGQADRPRLLPGMSVEARIRTQER
jgi:membrane fusion protein (multidrug efflux system)